MTNGSNPTRAFQRGFVRATRDADLGLVAPEAFVRGIRHIGYKSNVEAIAELVDNSIQAYAQRVDLVLGYEDERNAGQPTHLAIVDDGHGMSPVMMRFALMWGGTHRENDRSGLGRFGYGLPCATVSMGRRFTIYSKLRRGKVHAISLDLDLLDGGEYSDDEVGLSIPGARVATLPKFVSDVIAREYPGNWQSGTVIVIEKLDRLEWVTAGGLKRNLIRQFGVAYHKLLSVTAINIDGESVQAIDPLFLSPEARLYALDEDRAHALEPVRLAIELGGTSGEVVLRYAWLPPTFGATDKSRDAVGINANARFPILKQYHGIVFTRNGRVIDVHSRTPWTTFINNDRYIRVEIQFSAALDEEFGVTTSKQQVTVSPSMWDRLQTAGLPRAIEHLRAKVRASKTRLHRAKDRTNEISVTCDGAEGIAHPDGRLSPLASSPKKSENELLNGKSLGEVDSTIALSVLLSRIELRKSVGGVKIAQEYDRLLRGWKRELLRISKRA